MPGKAYENGIFLNKILNEASRQLETDERLILAIDALDEADRPQSGENLLCLPEELPKGVFVVATSRHQHFIPLRISHSQRFHLQHNSQENIEDIRDYIKFYLHDKQMQRQMQSFNMKPEIFIETMLTKSDGNFIYLHYVLPAIRDGDLLLGALENLPRGLKAYYQFHWEKMRNHDPETFDKLYKPVVCVLVAMKEEVSVDEIVEVTELEYNQVLQVVQIWREFLHKNTLVVHPVNSWQIFNDLKRLQKPIYRLQKLVQTYRMRQLDSISNYIIYHYSFQEFLEEEVDPGLRTYHRMIANAYLKQIKDIEEEEVEEKDK